MVRYLIIEDEPLAFEELKRMMDQLRPGFQIAGWAQSVCQSITLLRSQTFDLILADISLADGLCFDIFRQIDVGIPVIFTTAYDEYAIRAFKANGIDYLLKPVEISELEVAVMRYERNSVAAPSAGHLATLCDYGGRRTKDRFLVRSGDSYLHVGISEVAFFYSEDKYTFLHVFSGKRYIIDYSLDTLEDMLDRACFFRTSRNSIISIQAVVRCSKLFGGRLKLHCSPELPVESIVSRSRVRKFMEWIDGLV